ncbi:helix-turn-helix domain-containing protein [Mesorhizobium sp. VNQ89]|uniref:helix-turn-helix domain-containing protein n=1 Tax=Mesorhizobium quangtriensis TaxID=3157709 RepID=UPI0032B7B841
MSDTTNIFEEIPDDDTIGGRISRAREAAGLSVKDVAWRLGVKMATVKAWESDRSQPGSHRLSNLSGLLQVSLSWIIHGVGIGPSDLLADETNKEMTQQLDQLRLLHVETGQLIERLKGEVERIAQAR